MVFFNNFPPNRGYFRKGAVKDEEILRLSEGKEFDLDIFRHFSYYPHRFSFSNRSCLEGRYGSEILKPHFLQEEEWGFVFEAKHKLTRKGGEQRERSFVEGT